MPGPTRSWEDLLAATRGRQPRGVARLITRVENREPGWDSAMTELFALGGAARVIGLTGPPGAGKSSLTSQLTREFVDRGHRVGIIAVDPSSPFSGGALLGDRLRMRDVATVPGVFIRSMATRGMLGGLCQGARDVARILGAAGYDLVVLETVGVGQDEIEVVRAADVVVVVCVPGQGDGVQALKAGIMEIADLFVVNKADREGADTVADDIRAMQSMSADDTRECAPVLMTCALSGQGVEALADDLLERMAHATRDPRREAARVREELLSLIEYEVSRRVRERWDNTPRLAEAVEAVCRGGVDPYSAAQRLLRAE